MIFDTLFTLYIFKVWFRVDSVTKNTKSKNQGSSKFYTSYKIFNLSVRCVENLWANEILQVTNYSIIPVSFTIYDA